MSTSPSDRSERPPPPAPIQVQPKGQLGAPPPPMSPSARMDDIVIGMGVTSTGNFNTGGELCIDGVLRDSEVQAAMLSISGAGEFHGKAMVRHAEVFGTLSGEIVASEQIVLRSSAVVSGKLSAPYVVMHRGATVMGQVETLTRSQDPATPAK